MEKTTPLSSNILIVDNLLPDKYFKDLYLYASSLEYRTAYSSTKEAVWKGDNMNDPGISQNIVWTRINKYKSLLCSIDGISLFPTGTITDLAIARIHEILGETPMFHGSQDDWAGSLTSFCKYGTGNKLGWHDDGASYIGAFSYYIHPSWEKEWGGELLYKRTGFRDENACGIISPKPNRLVILKSPLEHAISTVTSPELIYRLTLTGFIFKSSRTEELIRNYASGA